MDRNRFLLFIAISLTILIGWTRLVVPLLNPPAANAPGKPAAKVAEENAGAKPDGEKPADEGRDAQMAVAAPVPQGMDQPDEKVDEPAAAKPKPKLKKHPQRTVLIGSLDPDTNYFAAVETTTTGGGRRSLHAQ